MAVNAKYTSISVPVSADLSASQFRIVNEVTTTGLLEVSDANTDVVLGILLNKPAGAGRGGEVAISGVVKLEAGAAIVVGAAIMATTGGRGTTTTNAGDWIVGVAQTAAAGSGTLFECYVNPSRY